MTSPRTGCAACGKSIPAYLLVCAKCWLDVPHDIRRETQRAIRRLSRRPTSGARWRRVLRHRAQVLDALGVTSGSAP